MINVSVLNTTARGTRWLSADLLPKTHKRTKSLDRVSTQSIVTGSWPVVSFLSLISYSRRTVKVKVETDPLLSCCRPPKIPRLFQSKGRKNISTKAGIDHHISISIWILRYKNGAAQTLSTEWLLKVSWPWPAYSNKLTSGWIHVISPKKQSKG